MTNLPIYQSTNYQRTDNLPQNGAGATRFYLILTQRHKEHKEKNFFIFVSLCLCVRNNSVGIRPCQNRVLR